METWIVFTLLAVVMQSVRTAGQKQIARKLSIEATTLVRFLFGLPFAGLYFFLLSAGSEAVLNPGREFFLSASGAGLAQIGATLCLVKALTIRNFAVGTALAKTEAIAFEILRTTKSPRVFAQTTSRTLTTHATHATHDDRRLLADVRGQR